MIQSFRFISILFLSALMLSFQSCKKENPAVAQIIQGSLSLEVHAVHHTWDVSGITIYLKRNAVEFPGTDTLQYEYKGVADGYGKFTFEELYPGNYYVYATGFDAIWGSNVIGYSPYVLSKETTIGNSGIMTLLVSE